MLTASQARTAAFVNEYGELISAEEAHDALDYGTLEQEQNWRPLSQYELDEWQRERWAGEDPADIWGDDGEAHSNECAPGFYSDWSGDTLVEEYHYHPEAE